MSMNPERKKLWTDALRSGRFEQGEGALADTSKGTFCCLGVACEVAIENGLQLSVVVNADPDATTYGKKFYAGNSGTMPAEVAEWYGLAYSENDGRPDNPVVTVGDLNANITVFNDGTSQVVRNADGERMFQTVHLTFPELADVIDEQL